uniref:Phostensin/Taperin PP1-binding domain-containing protein n=1 Tax=Mola mola TaxID=94237 RepID=A0A3Q3XBG4_MOLML
MSVSSLPEWKQLLLERKRREEEERERKEKQEEEKFASMPAWKRGIIQRRKAKQDSLGDREKERDVKPVSEVSVETIVPVHENPFILTQSSRRRGRDAELGNETEVKEKERDKLSPRSQDGELGKGRDEDQQGKRAMKMDLREILAVGGSVTEIRASEVLIIKPSESPEERNAKGGVGGKGLGKEDGELKGSVDGRWEGIGRELRTDISWLRGKEKERPWGQATVIKEERKDSLDDNVFVDRGGRTQRQQSTRGLLKHQEKDDTKTHEKDQETSKPKVTAECAHSPTPPLQQLNQTVTITPPLLRSRSPDDTLNQSDCTPTPASFPRSPSPAQSPSISPSPTPSPPLFSIRSASGAVTGSTTGSTTASLTPAKTLTQQTQATSAVAEQGKKKYPTVEEIEVIGGYQNLEKSCLVKNRLTPKKVSVCFDEDQLEQVCEYPSETSMLAYSPYPHDPWKLQWEEAHEKDAEAESGTITSKSAKNMGTGVGRCLRVGQCHPLLRKHNV